MKQYKRFTYAFSGIAYALKTDLSYQTQVIGGALAIGLFMYLVSPLEKVDILFLGIAYTLILITELQNLSFEVALDKMHPEKHHDIGRSKDMAAGAVLTSGFFLVFVMCMIVFF